jgi:cytochrome c oxidase assembly factor CtaG
MGTSGLGTAYFYLAAFIRIDHQHQQLAMPVKLVSKREGCAVADLGTLICYLGSYQDPLNYFQQAW